MNRPEDATDAQIHAFFGDDFALERHTAEVIKRIEVLCRTKVPAKAELDLRGREFDIRYECHGVFKGKPLWTCWDNKTYDGEESHMGYGDSKEDALVDYLDKVQD